MADYQSANDQSPNGTATGSGRTYSINLSKFSEHLKALYSHWNEHKDDLWHSADVFGIATPPLSEDSCYSKSSALSIWLLQHELPQTIMVFTKKEIHFLSSPSIASLLEDVKKSAKKAVGVDVVLHVRDKTDDGTALVDAIFKSVKTQCRGDENDVPASGYIAEGAPELKLLKPRAGKLESACFQLTDAFDGLSALFAVKDNEELNMREGTDDGTASVDAILKPVIAEYKGDEHDAPVFGYIAIEAPERELFEPWAGKLKSACFQLMDVTDGLSAVLAVKDKEELKNVKIAAKLIYHVMRNVVVPKLRDAIDEKREISHATLMDETKKAILGAELADVQLDPVQVDICYPPIFQSGGIFDLGPAAASNEKNLHYSSGNEYDAASVIICSVGARYSRYCSNTARTFLVDANVCSFQAEAQRILLKAQQAAITKLKPGNRICAAYNAAASAVKKCIPALVRYLTKSAGTGIGLEFAESGLDITAENKGAVRVGMVFNVSLGFSNLPCYSDEPKNRVFSLLVADTVIICEDQTEVVTDLLNIVEDRHLYYCYGDEDIEREEEEGMPERARTIARFCFLSLRKEKAPKNISVPLSAVPSSTEDLREFLKMHQDNCSVLTERYMDSFWKFMASVEVANLYDRFFITSMEDLFMLGRLRGHNNGVGEGILLSSTDEKSKRELIQKANAVQIPLYIAEDTHHDRHMAAASRRALMNVHEQFIEREAMRSELQSGYKYVYMATIYWMKERYLEQGVAVYDCVDLEALKVLKKIYLTEFKCIIDTSSLDSCNLVTEALQAGLQVVEERG